MKKLFKKSIFLFLLMVISIIGVTNVNAQGKNIEVTDITIKDKTGTITVAEPTLSDGKINSEIKFNKVGDYVTFEVTLKNIEEDKYKITSITDNNENENIDVEYTYDKDFIEKDKTSKVTIKMTYKNKLVNKDISLDDLSIILNLEKEDGSSSQITINPQTGDNILRYVALFIMSGLGLFFVITKKRIKGFKVGNLLLIISVILIPFTVLANEKYELSIKFTNIEVKGEFEVYNITIDPKDGSSIVIKEITYGQPIGELPENPEKDGYEFDKWVDDAGNEITEETIITDPIEIEAKFNAIKYDISYNLNGGSLPSGKTNPNKYTIESNDITLNNPTKTGYTFSGWTGSNGETPSTSVTITKGTTGNKNYVANYSANQDTVYTVTHRYENLDGSYSEEVSTEHGATDTEVAAPLKEKTGFISPSTQNVTINGDGSSKVTYTYEREEYSFSITDRTYIDNTSTEDGTYKYETEITIKAVEREGYTFKWSDNDTNYERTFNLEEATSLTPIYTANTNTAYTVKHYKMNIDGTNYTLADTQNLTGTTDTSVTPTVNTYTGFTAPSAQTVTISGDGTTVVEYYYTRNQYTLTITNSKYVEEGGLSGDYYYEEEITLTAVTRDGYTLKWSDDSVDNPKTVTIGTSNISIGPVYTANTNTAYTVKHYKMDVDGTNYTLADTQNLTGTTDTSVTPTVNTYTGFTAPSAQTVTISGDGSTEVIYNYTRNQYTLTIEDIEYVKEDKSGDYYYGAEVTIEADTREGYTFTGWSNGETDNPLTITIGLSNITIKPLYEANTYTVTFDTDGGSTISSQTVAYGNKATKPTNPTKTGYTFDNWYTDDTYATTFDFDNTVITSDITIYAKFDELNVCDDNENITTLSSTTCSNNENITVGDGMVCKRAVKLHEETCSQTSSYCYASGYTTSGSKGTSTITYGNCGTSGTLVSGDAFTCDVNGDGTYDEITERFYYVSDYYDTTNKEFDTSTAVLIYYNNVTSGVSCNKNTYAYYSSASENWHGPVTLISQLPTTSQWTNVSLKNTSRAILAEYQTTHDSATTSGGTLPTDFSYSGYAARFLTAKELMSGCNLSVVGNYRTGELDSCNYLMENTKYAKSSLGSYGHWLETPLASYDNYVFNVNGNGRYRSVDNYNASYSSNCGARPTIEVQKSKISY